LVNLVNVVLVFIQVIKSVLNHGQKINIKNLKMLSGILVIMVLIINARIASPNVSYSVVL